MLQNFYKEECDVAKLEALHLKSKVDCEKLFLLSHIVWKKSFIKILRIISFKYIYVILNI